MIDKMPDFLDMPCIQNVSTPAYLFKSRPKKCQILGKRHNMKKIYRASSSSMDDAISGAIALSPA